jgi:predicted deacylase
MFNILSYFKSAPVFEVWHSHPHLPSVVLITAGMHGDELSSIKAAESIIKNYRGSVPITVIPILNLAGYNTYVSHNPLDNRDPIYIYPGSRFGSSTARLMFELSTFTKGKKFWIDLHGGAKNEQLKPFIWAADKYSLLSHLKGRTLIDASFKRNLPYIILEAGELGKIEQKSVNLHLIWIRQILENLDKSSIPGWHPTYTGVKYEKNVGQDVHTENFLWSSPTHYMSGLYDDISR